MSKVIFGLGNSGAEYAGTRHNVGAMLLAKLSDGFGGRFAKNKFARALVSKVQICSQEVHLAFCEGFMNNSGDGVARTLAFFRADPSQAVVIYDDITIGFPTLGGFSQASLNAHQPSQTSILSSKYSNPVAVSRFLTTI